MSKKDIEYCNGLWAKAEAAATTDEQLQQVRRSGLSWRYWQCMNKCGEFSRWQFPYVYMNAGERLHHDLKEMGITMFGEGGHVELSDCELLYYFRPANKWTLIFEEWFWDILNPFAVAIYKVTGFIYKLFN